MRAAASPAPARTRVTRRALTGAAWTLAWMLVWGVMLLMFAKRAHAAPLELAVSSGPVSLPIYVAQARGYFKDEGLELRLRDCSSGRECYQWLAEGQVDLATAAELMVATGDAARRELAIIATISTSSYQIKLVARRSAKIAEASQIRGKRIGTVPGSSAEYFLDSWLVYNDIDPTAVTIAGLSPDKLVAALQARELDAIAIWEPLASSAALALGGDALTFVSPRVYTQHFNLVATRAVRERRADEIARLLRALLRAQQAIQAEPETARTLLAQRLRLPPVLAASAMDGEDYRLRLDQSLVSTMQSEARWAAAAAGASRGGIDVLRAIDPGPLHRVDPAAVGLVR